MARSKRTAQPLLTEPEEAEPPRVAEVAAVADRAERQRLLSAILRDGKASGAEAVAAARLLEAMERASANSDQIGIPPPTSRPDQVMRIVRLLTGAGPRMTCEALEIIAQRSERMREVTMQNRKDGKLFDVAGVTQYRKRLLPKEESNAGRKGKRSKSDASGTPAAEPSGLPELSEVAESVGPPADANERNGIGDDSAVAEIGEQV